MRALVTGATGLIGKRLVSELLARGDDVVALVRNVDSARMKLGPNVELHRWASSKSAPPMDAMRGIEAVFNLMGEPIAAGRWTDAKKATVFESRVDGTRQLVDALAEHAKGGPAPRVFVSASGISFYGHRGDDPLDEGEPAGSGFLEDLSVAWEREAHGASRLGARVVTPRIGLVLAKGGGALAEMGWAFRSGLGGRLGSGKQWWSWIHIDDVIGLFLHATQKAQITGPMNAVAPNPVTNAVFTKTFGAAIHRPTIFAVPTAALKVAFGEKASILLASQRVVPAVAERSGYTFRYTELAQAFTSLT